MTTTKPQIARLGLIPTIVTWWTMSRELTQLAKGITSPAYYNANRHAIKYEVRRRVSAVLNGFDRRSQTLLFKCNILDDSAPRLVRQVGGAR